MKALTLDEIHTRLLQLMDAVDRFCRDQGLRYSLAYGTLLGAVRHGGFIPWDDDADLMMPREDFEYFVRHFPSDGRFRCLYNYADQDAAFIGGYAKVEDRETISIEKRRKGIYRFGLNLDIFPLDGAPDQDSVAFSRKIKSLRHRIFLSQRPILPFSFHVPLIPLLQAHRHPPEWWMKRYLEEITRYPLGSTAFGGPLSGGCGAVEVYPAELFSAWEDIAFEGRRYRAIRDWDAFLRQQYGHYMELPPENKRITHGLNVYLK